MPIIKKFTSREKIQLEEIKRRLDKFGDKKKNTYLTIFRIFDKNYKL